MIVTHSTVASAPNDPAREVSTTAWNADHAITGLVAVDISDSSGVGRSVLTAADAAAARSAIGAGTSSFGGSYAASPGITALVQSVQDSMAILMAGQQTLADSVMKAASMKRILRRDAQGNPYSETVQ